MAIDARVREGLQRAMSGIAVDTEARLEDSRRRGYARLVLRRTLAAAAVAAAVAVVAVITPRVLDLAQGRGYQPATIPSLLPDTTSEGILGTWQSEYTCDAFVRGFEEAGIGDRAARWLINFGLEQGPVRHANSGHLCRGADQFLRTHTFLPNGIVITHQDQRVADDCRCFEVLHRHTFHVLGTNGDPIATLRYTIDAGTLTFDAVMPNQCSRVCRGHFAWAVGNYAVTVWHRVA
jgi:hypothetical protein